MIDAAESRGYCFDTSIYAAFVQTDDTFEFFIFESQEVSGDPRQEFTVVTALVTECKKCVLETLQALFW
jgi:hypothetical protein